MWGPAELVSNFHWIIEGEAARSSQGAGVFLGSILESHGIRALVNLRGVHPQCRWWRKDEELCARLGIARFDAMLDSRKLPTRRMLAALIDAYEHAPRPLLIKCAGGQDRTSLGAAIYVLHRKDWAAREEAMAQLGRAYRHFPKRGQEWLAAFPAYAEEHAGGRPIAQWIREAYDPADFAGWLDRNGLARGFGGIVSWPWMKSATALSRRRLESNIGR